MKFNRSTLFIGLGAIGAILFFYFNRHHALTHAIKSYGSTSIFAGILMMTLIFLTPIPSEGLLLIFFNVYGVMVGLMYAWTSYVISIILLFVVSRYLITTFIRRSIKSSWFEMVEGWLKEKGVLGLLIARMLPIPAFFVNCIMGAMPSISFWKYFLTAVVAIIPYYINSSLLYLGITSFNYKVLLIGIPILIGGWWLSVKVKEMNQVKKRPY